MNEGLLILSGGLLLLALVAFRVFLALRKRRAQRDARWRRSVRHLRDGSFAVGVERVAFHGSSCTSLESRFLGRTHAAAGPEEDRKYVELLEEATELVDHLNKELEG